MSWHERSIDETYAHLGARREGLSAQEVERRRAQHGFNVLVEAPPRPPLLMFLTQFADVMVLILIGAAIVSGLIGDLADTVIIVAIIVLNAILGFVQEFRAERAMAALKAMAAPSATVMRDGAQAALAAAELVPGDVVMIEAGRIVPADLRLVEVAGLRVDESALTGESVPVDKVTGTVAGSDIQAGDRRNIAHKGSVVTYGRAVGRMLLHAMTVSHDAGRDHAGSAVGDPTEVALLLAAEALGCDRTAETVRTPRIAEIPFDSRRKRMTTVHRQADGSFLSISP